MDQFDALTKACRLCGSEDLVRQLDLGQHPLANAYHDGSREATRRESVLPLRLVACRSCGHPQLDITVRPEAMFADYAYVSGTSQTLKAHFADLAEQSCHIWRNQTYDTRTANARVLDIAANDGTLVKSFQAVGGCTPIGMDPARNIVDRVRAEKVPVMHGYWPADRPKLKGLKADIITACNVLAHVDQPVRFIEAALDSLNPGGLLVLEFPYALDTLLHNEWDQIYHEHLSYFLMRPLLMALNKLNASVIHAVRTPIHGGSIRLYLQRLFPDKAAHCMLVGSELIFTESMAGLDSPEEWGPPLREHVRETGRALRLATEMARDKGLKVVGYGASAKGNTVLNTFPDIRLDYIADDSRFKQGLFTPGTDIPIVDPQELATDPSKLAVVLLAWNFGREIVERIVGWRGGEDEWISYVPNVATGRMDAFDAEVSA